MNTMDIANKMVELCRQGKNIEALSMLFADDVVSVEAGASPGTSWGPNKLGSGLSLSYWVFYVVFFVSLYLKEM
jgi:hypothetical protein